jgi:hypothetical protein
MTAEEVAEVERLVNSWVIQAAPTITTTMGLQVSCAELCCDCGCMQTLYLNMCVCVCLVAGGEAF